MKKTKRIIVSIILSLVMAFSMFGLTACIIGGLGVNIPINFVANGEVVATVTATNETIEMPQNPQAPEGYKFTAWYWDYGTWQTPFTLASIANQPLTDNMRVYARFVSIKDLCNQCGEYINNCVCMPIVYCDLCEQPRGECVCCIVPGCTSCGQCDCICGLNPEVVVNLASNIGWDERGILIQNENGTNFVVVSFTTPAMSNLTIVQEKEIQGDLLLITLKHWKGLDTAIGECGATVNISNICLIPISAIIVNVEIATTPRPCFFTTRNPKSDPRISTELEIEARFFYTLARPLNQDLSSQIRFFTDLFVQQYFGNFGYYFEVMFFGGFPVIEPVWEERINIGGGTEVVFRYTDGRQILVYHAFQRPPNTFHSLTEAFEMGFISGEDLIEIAKLWQGNIIMPQPVCPDCHESHNVDECDCIPFFLHSLSDTRINPRRENNARRYFASWINRGHEIQGASFENTFVRTYLGTYRTMSIVKMDSTELGWGRMAWTETVGGVTFFYPNTNRFRVFNGNDFFTLTEAYNLGLITAQDLMKAHAIYSSDSIYKPSSPLRGYLDSGCLLGWREEGTLPVGEVVLVNNVSKLNNYFNANAPHRRFADFSAKVLASYDDAFFVDSFLLVAKIRATGGGQLFRVDRIDKNGDIIIQHQLGPGHAAITSHMLIIELCNTFLRSSYRLLVLDPLGREDRTRVLTYSAR